MSAETTARVLAEVAADLVRYGQTGDVLATLVRGCADAYPAGAVAILVIDENDGTLQPLSATSHRAAELELLQAQAERGPCIDAVRSDQAVHACDVGDMTERWGEVGSAVREAGFGAVDAYPMHWQGRVVGGLNVFRREPEPVTAHQLVLGQLFADIATLALVRAQVPPERVTARIHEAVTARAVIEQAKGVLAYGLDLDMGDAYDALVDEARRSGATLSDTARAVVARQHQSR